MDKYGRNYLMLIEKSDGTTLQIAPPFTIQFEIHRNSFSSASIASFRIYNLAENTRSSIRHDEWNTSDQRKIEFRAGYGENLPFAFRGHIAHAWSVREGNNMITQVECFDGGLAYINAISAAQFSSGTPQTSIFASLIKDMNQYGVSIGAVGNYSGQITRGNSFVGNTPKLLAELSGGGFFIDNSKANVLKDDECIEGPIILINAATGLLGTPLLESQLIRLEMLFEPSLQIAQLAKLETTTADRAVNSNQISFNGVHKVVSLVHRGIISPAVSGEAVTSVSLLPGAFTPIPQAVA